MHPFIKTRLSSWGEMFKGKFMWFLSAIWGAIGYLSLVKVEFLPERFQSYTAAKALNFLSWRTWLIVLLILLIGVILEGGHAAIQKREILIEQHKREIIGLESKLGSLHLDSLPWRAIALCHEINNFVDSFGPQPEIKYTSGMSAEHFTQENSEGIDRQSKMVAGFIRKFNSSVVDIYNEFCEHGQEWNDKELENAMSGKMDEFVDSQIKIVVDGLTRLSARMWAETTLHPQS